MIDNDVRVQVNHLYRYYDEHCAVHDVSFELRKGEVLGFLGPNGAGKTTTMQMLAGTLAPSAGEVKINGIDILDRPKAAKAAIGYLPERPPVYPELTVDEYLNYCARLNRVARAKIGEAREHVKRRCGLHATGGRLIGNLSKGYQQRVGIAQAIIHAPAVVILDEPTVGLDPIQIREIRDLIQDLGAAHSVILSTHILPEVQATCSRVQIIHKGRLVFNESIAALGERMRSESLVVAARELPSLEAIVAIPDVTHVESCGDGRVRITHSRGKNPAESIAQCAVDGGWGLLELTPERKSLEQIFVELTAADESAEAVSSSRQEAA